MRFHSDPDCEGHRCENGVYGPQPDDGDESADEDSCSEHSSSTSTSTNQKEGKYCDCCYCEFFGHGGVSAQPRPSVSGRHSWSRQAGAPSGVRGGVRCAAASPDSTSRLSPP